MLAEKFILVLEALKRNARDGSPVVASTSPHVPVILPLKNRFSKIDRGRLACGLFSGPRRHRPTVSGLFCSGQWPISACTSGAAVEASLPS